MNVEYAEKYFKISFEGNNFKEAYMKACKWVATNVISNKDINNSFVKYEKDENGKYPTIVVHLYVSMKEGELRKEHCKICKEVQGAWLMKDDINHSCDWCKVKAYQRRADDAIKVKRDYYKEQIKKNER